MNIVEALPTDLKWYVARFLPVGPPLPFLGQIRQGIRLKTVCDGCKRSTFFPVQCCGSDEDCTKPHTSYCRDCWSEHLDYTHEGPMCPECSDEFYRNYHESEYAYY